MTHDADSIRNLLEEAADTLRRLQYNEPKDGPQGYKSCMPATVREYWAHYGKEKISVKPGPPTAEAIDNLNRVLGWMAGAPLEEWQRKMLWGRAKRYPVPWKKICRKINCGRTKAWQEWVFALSKVAHYVNHLIIKNTARTSPREQELRIAV